MVRIGAREWCQTVSFVYVSLAGRLQSRLGRVTNRGTRVYCILPHDNCRQVRKFGLCKVLELVKDGVHLLSSWWFGVGSFVEGHKSGIGDQSMLGSVVPGVPCL